MAAAATKNTRFALTISLLRGVLLFAAGVMALIFPTLALKFAVIVGGCLLIVDGILGGLASQGHGIEAPWPYWLSFSRGVLAIVAGLALLCSPLLAAVLTPEVLAKGIGAGALAVGIIELIVLMGFKKDVPAIWNTFFGAAIYIALGLTLLFVPLSATMLILQIAGVLLAILGILQITKAWSAGTKNLGARSAR